jgi:uncharacterized protein
MDDATHQMHHYVKSAFREKGSHGLDHVLRVVYLCETIGSREHADMRILRPAALFHDIARPIEEETGIPHEKEGAQIAERFLRSIRYEEELVQKIVHAIRAHRYRSSEQPETLEARILSDADKLDAMGAVGIARTFLRAGEHHGEISDATGHIHEKLLKLKSHMYTETARTIAEERHRFLLDFLAALSSEMVIPDSSKISALDNSHDM